MTRYLFCAVALFTQIVLAQPLYDQAETRYCGQPERTAQGGIKRSSAAKAAFAKVHPCPATGLPTMSCPGWQIDHIIPLASCGCDAVRNMQWLPVEIKTCAGAVCKDRWERKVYQCQ